MAEVINNKPEMPLPILDPLKDGIVVADTGEKEDKKN